MPEALSARFKLTEWGPRQRACPWRHRDKLVSRKVMLIGANPALPLMEI
jgi:hypothetical protein